ncbi:GAF domain-containing protein, partial [Acidithiobacillus sp. IBUN Pt1247-S3]
MDQLISAVSQSNGTEDLARSLLKLMQEVTGFESVYLTTIDWNLRLQRVLYVQKQHEWGIPEGLIVDWEDTLCKRALEEGQSYTPNVAERWPDAELALSLGISTYFSLPVYSGTEQAHGTLCAVDRRSVCLDTEQLRLLEMLS